MFSFILKDLKRITENGFKNRQYEKSEEFYQKIENIYDNKIEKYLDETLKKDVLINHLNDLRTDSFTKLLSQVDIVKFDEFQYDNVIDYYEVLEVICTKNNFEFVNEYKDVKGKFYNSLQDNIQKKLEGIIQASNQEEELRSLTNMKSRFPKQMQFFFDYKFENMTRRKETAMKEFKSKIEKLTVDNDFNNLIKNFNENAFPEIQEEIKKAVSDKVNSCVECIKASLTKEDPQSFINSLKNYDLFVQSSDQIDKEDLTKAWVVKPKSDVLKTYNEYYQKNIDKVLKSFDFTDFDLKSDNEVATMQTLVFLLEVAKPENANYAKYLPSYDSDISSLMEKIQLIIEKDQKFFDDFRINLKVDQSKLIEKLIHHRKKCENPFKILRSPDIIQIFSNSDNNTLKTFAASIPKMKVTELELKEELINNLNSIKENFANFNFEQKEQTDNATKARDYDKMSKQLSFMEGIKPFDQLDQRFTNYYEDCFNIFKTKLDAVIEEIDDTYLSDLNRFKKEEECFKFNKKMDNLTFLEDKIPKIKKEYHQKVNNISSKLINNFEEKKKAALNTTDQSKIIDSLVQLQTVIVHVTIMKKPEWVDEILLSYKQNAEKKGLNGSQELNKLGVLLLAEPVGQLITSENKLFKGVNLSVFNDIIQKYPIEEVLKKMEGDDLDNLDTIKLKKRYDEFIGLYEKIVTTYLLPKDKGGINLNALLVEFNLELKSMATKFNSLLNWFTSSPKFEMPKILAYLFAIWTLMNAEDFFEISETADADNKKKFLFRPHAAQLISIFRMVSCGDKDESIANNMVQIGTGEGKSITLAMTSAIFALLGYDVDCACYSPYLSQRDYEGAKGFFELLNVKEFIEYGTFNRLCEKNINSEVNIREKVLSFFGIESNQNEKKGKKEKRDKVLLIDEVDIFFSKDFYGALYTPSAVVKHPAISGLLKMIWAQKTTIAYNSALTSPEYKVCLDAFPKRSHMLLAEALKDMVAAAKTEIQKNYLVINDKIGYKDQDSISFKKSYGYATSFTYLLENQEKNISDSSLEDYMGLIIKSSSFSFAEIPKKAYKFIMGVTGTLKTLADSQKKILKDNYHLKKSTYMPSVFGEANRAWDPFMDVFIEEEIDFYERIKKRIEKDLDSNRRAVLVFFKDEETLRKFYDSSNFQYLRDKTAILTEAADADEKRKFVLRATLGGMISLMPRCFGRGTDFKCRDDAVRKAGGVAVIQTFLSLDRSEQVQVMGRCARQGDDGSYCMVLLRIELEEFLIINIPETNKYKYLDDMRNQFFDNENLKNEQVVKNSNEEHNKSMKFLDLIKNNDEIGIQTALLENNKGVELECKCTSRTLCLMDATGSMSNLLDNTKKTVSLVFKRAKEVLKEEGANPDCFELQIGFYRNYGSGPTKLFEHSDWVKKPDVLQVFMDSNGVSGGQGNEAIEVGLWYANKEYDSQKITQIILIGDASPNSEDDVKKKRGTENKWANTEYKNPTFYKTELAQLQSKGIKIYTFYVWKDDSLKKSFEEIAKDPKNCRFLDVNNAAKGSEDLLDSLTKVILNDVGGEKFEAKYDNKFKTIWVSYT